MPARDFYHNTVILALQKDGWAITHDPYRLKLARGKNLFVDLGAERLIAAEKDMEKITILRLFTFSPEHQEIVTWLPPS